MKIILRVYAKWEGRNKPTGKIPNAIVVAEDAENRYYLSADKVVNLVCQKKALFDQLHAEYKGGVTPEKLAKQIYHNTKSYQASIILDGILEGDNKKIMNGLKDGETRDVEVKTNPPAPAEEPSTTKGGSDVTTKKKAIKKKAAKKKAATKKKVSKAAAKNTVSKKKAAASNGAGRKVDPDFLKKKITVKVKENPKRSTAAERFNLYKNGMTVEKYIAAGGNIRDVRWDEGKGWIKLS